MSESVEEIINQKEVDRENILVISKDVLRKDYLGCYGSKICDTPNIDKLADKGTVFTNYYAAAPSTAMAVTCMFSGLNAYELDRAYYKEVEQFTKPTMFSILESTGYETHVVWPDFLHDLGWRYSKIFDRNTKVHNLHGTHFNIGEKGQDRMKTSINKGNLAVRKFYEKTVELIKNAKNPIFIWIHCPHNFQGSICYGDDINLFDNLVGQLIDFFDGAIYLTADHGNMGGDKNLFDYGDYVYEGAVNIPLITPNHFDKKIINDPIGSIQLKNIILEKKICPQKFVYSDTRYYKQPGRKLMIRLGDYKYIYNKKDKSEELYDLKYDPHEDVNLLMARVVSTNMRRTYFLDEMYYHPRWEEAKEAYFELKNEKDRIWKNGSKSREFLLNCRQLTSSISKYGVSDTISVTFKPRRTKGRFGGWAKVR